MNRTCNFLAALVFSGVLATAALAGLPTPPEPWDAGGTGYEDDPVSTDPVAGGDDHLRGVKEEVRTRLNVEHQFGNITNMNAVSYDNGLHRLGSARCFIRDDSPDSLCGDVGAGENCGDHPNTSGPSQVTTLSAVGNQSDPNDIGHGRCWIDVDGPDNVDNTADDFTLMVFDENTASGSWVRAGATRDRLLHNGPNLLYNGDFEIEGDGSTATPVGWTANDGGGPSGGPVFDVNVTEATQGAGLDLEVTADVDIDGNDTISQVLSGLKADTTYTFTARAMPVGTADICVIDVAGESSAVGLPASATTVGAWQTIAGTFTTDGTPAAVTITLENDDTDVSTVCTWDRVSVYEQQDQPMSNTRGFLWTIASTSTESNGMDADTVYDELSSPVMEVPSDNCYAVVDYDFNWEITAGFTNDETCEAVWRLQYCTDASCATWADLDEGIRDPQADTASNHSGYVNEDVNFGFTQDAYNVNMAGKVGNLTAGNAFGTRLLLDYINACDAADTLILSPTWTNEHTPASQTKEHRASVEMVCH